MATRITVNTHVHGAHAETARGCPFLGGQKRRRVRWPGSRSGAVELHRVRPLCVLAVLDFGSWIQFGDVLGVRVL